MAKSYFDTFAEKDLCADFGSDYRRDDSVDELKSFAIGNHQSSQTVARQKQRASLVEKGFLVEAVMVAKAGNLHRIQYQELTCH